jgi:hypothetical protein
MFAIRWEGMQYTPKSYIVLTLALIMGSIAVRGYARKRRALDRAKREQV